MKEVERQACIAVDKGRAELGGGLTLHLHFRRRTEPWKKAPWLTDEPV